MSTSCGDIGIRLDPSLAPETVNSFVFLASEGYFDGTVFHRVIPGFIAQGGDQTATGTGGPGYVIPTNSPTYGALRSRRPRHGQCGPWDDREPILRHACRRQPAAAVLHLRLGHGGSRNPRPSPGSPPRTVADQPRSDAEHAPRDDLHQLGHDPRTDDGEGERIALPLQLSFDSPTRVS